MLAPLFFIFFSIFIPFKTGLKTDGSISQPSFISFVMFLFLIGSFLLMFTLFRLKSERKFNPIDFIDKQGDQLPKYIKDLGWIIIQKESNYIQANTKISWSSWGEIITIIIEENRILFNSRPNGQPITFTKDRVNFNKFKDLITPQINE